MNLTTLKGEFYGSICPVPSHSLYASQGQKNFTPEEDARYNKGLAFYLLTENAINELHNNGIIARLVPESAVLVHDPNPFTRATVKHHLAHQIADDYVKGLETPLFSNSSDVLHARRVQLANYAAPASGLK